MKTIPLHIADAAVAACEAEIQKLREENASLKAEAELTNCQSEADRLKAENEELHKDYEALADEHTKLIDRNKNLKAEVERLRNAGDAMADAINEHRHGKGGAWGEGFIVREKWKTAKEGKQS